MNIIKSLIAALLAYVVTAGVAFAWSPLSVVDDPLVRMPGTQPDQVLLEKPTRCLNCHEGYNAEVEPGFNWKGSMMAHSARDFLFYACMTTAAQDSIWATGTPNAVDICERCHFPKGWLEGRSDPTNASAMTDADFDGVQCDFCHQAWDPFFVDTHLGEREGSDWLGYWDETSTSDTPSDVAAGITFNADSQLAETIQLFSGAAFFTDTADGPVPPAGYTENAAGQYFVSPGGEKRASFADAAARHQILYSRYHKSKYFCSTCHDVSNPVLANLGAPVDSPLPTEETPAYSYFHVERTFSEFMLSAYGQAGGAETNLELQQQGAPNITHAAKCQDCHMRDVVGAGANKNGAPIRPDQSIEHPQSGQPLHDLTGGNVWVSTVLASSVPGSPNYDSNNDTLLNQGPAVLTLDLTQGQGIDPVALLAGAERARQQLLLAATIKNLDYSQATGDLSFRVQNNTGHKLISGFPEGRRMFINVRAYDAGGNLIYEVNPYSTDAGTLKGLPTEYSPNSPSLVVGSEVYDDELVYEMHPTSSLTGESETFHFALATGRHKDNRIPPKGFDIAGAAERLSVPVYYRADENGVVRDVGADYFTADEYAGGYDDVSLQIAPGADSVEVTLYYQTTSREYIEFLRDEINGDASTLSGLGAGGDPAYIAQREEFSNGFFDGLKAWGNTIWDIWDHNRHLDGAAPLLMAQAVFGAQPPAACGAPVPDLLSIDPASGQLTLSWSDEHSGDANVVGYNVYYDQAGKAQLHDQVDRTTSYTDTGLSNDQLYCYKVTSRYADCESDPNLSNTLCGTPTAPGQAQASGVASIQTGSWTGKGKNKTFVIASTFNQGDQIIFRALVVDQAGDPIEGATVDLSLTGESTASISTAASDPDGIAEATWSTSSKGGNKTPTGSYTVTTTGVTAVGYTWDGVQTNTSFTLQ